MISLKDIFEILKKKGMRQKKKLLTPNVLQKQNNLTPAKKNLISIHPNISRDLLSLNFVDYRITTTKVVNEANIIFYNKHFSLDYVRLALELDINQYDMIITIKTFRTGGTDKLLLRYLEGIKFSNPKINIILLILEGDSGEWDDLVPENVTLIYLKKYTKSSFNQTVYNQILQRLIIQFEIKILWNFNCRETYNFTERCSPFIREYLSVWGLVFAHWLRPGSLQEFGMAHENLPFVIDDYDVLISDNKTFTEYLCHQYGWNQDKFKTLYVPNSSESIQVKHHRKGNSLKFLWASGIEWNKGVEILPKIAEKISNLPITIDIYGGTKNKDGEDLLLKLNKDILLKENIKYKGKFDNFRKLVEEGQYDCFLFTSIIEGMPNVIIEAAERQMSIITPLIGGLGEFLNSENAYIVDNKNDVEKYIIELQKVLENKNTGKFTKEINLAHSYNKKFTLDSFKLSYNSLQDYLYTIKDKKNKRIINEN